MNDLTLWEIIVAAISIIHVIFSIPINWHKIKNPFSYSEKKKIESFITIVNCSHINESLKKLAKQKLQNACFSYLHGFSLNDKIPAIKVLNIIGKSEKAIDTHDFKLAMPYITIENDKIKVKNRNPKFWTVMSWSFIPITIALYMYIFWTNNKFYSNIELSLLVIYPVITILALFYMPKINASIKKIKSEIARQQEL